MVAQQTPDAAPLPTFLTLNGHRLFTLQWPAHGTVRGTVLVLPAFAEEMNRLRSHVATQARALARAGWQVMAIDLAGTGESDGELEDMAWPDWLADAHAACLHLKARHPGPLVVWGMRTGALLATDLAVRYPGLVDRLLLQQPVTDGKLFLTQTLRLRVASVMVNGQQPETTDGILARLRAGEVVEVAGYPLGRALADSLAERKLAPHPALVPVPIGWLELVGKPGQTLGPASARLCEALRQAGCTVSAQVVEAPPLWQVHERADAPALASALLALLEDVAALPADGAVRPSQGLGHHAAVAPPPEAVPAAAASAAGSALPAREVPVTFDCEGDALVGMVHVPARVTTRGVLILVAGGPQYRGGVGRVQLKLARTLAASGTPVMRFDHRGVGDSAGRFRDFEDVAADLRTAVAQFLAAVPGMTEVVLWGGCNAASAIMINGHTLPAVTGLVISNPWVHTPELSDEATVSVHFRQRALEWDFWRKVLRLQYNPLPALGTLARSAHNGLRQAWRSGSADAVDSGRTDDLTEHFIPRMRRGMSHFKGDVLLLMSGKSMVSKEFDTLLARSAPWQQAMRRPRHLARHDMPEADQTHSSTASRDELIAVARAWLQDRAADLSAAAAHAGVTAGRAQAAVPVAETA